MDYTSISDHLQHPVSLNKFLALSRGERNENLHSNFVKPSISTQQKRNKQKQVLPTTKWLFRCLAAAPLPIYCDAPEAMRQLAKPLRKEEKKILFIEKLFLVNQPLYDQHGNSDRWGSIPVSMRPTHKGKRGEFREKIKKKGCSFKSVSNTANKIINP